MSAGVAITLVGSPAFAASAYASAPPPVLPEAKSGPPQLPPMAGEQATPDEDASPDAEATAESGSPPPPPPPPEPESTAVPAPDPTYRPPDGPMGDPTAAHATADPFAEAAASEQEGRRVLIHRPIPTWKKAALGTSGAIAGLSLGLAIGFAVPVMRSRNKRGRLYEDIESAAQASLTDDKDLNDVDPNATDGNGNPINMCDVAQEVPDPSNQPGTVRNANVAELCRRGDRYATAATASTVVFGISAVATAVFTGLLFVRPKKGGAASAAQKRSVRIGASYSRRTLALRASWRF